MQQEQRWKKVVEPKGKLFDLKLKELWNYRDLTFLFVKRDFISKYKQTILGPMWALIQPLLTTIVFTVIFGNLANLTTADTENMGNVIIPSFLFYMSGTIFWTYFSTTVQTTSNTFIANMSIMGKVYYPRMVTPISVALSNLISLFIQMIMLFVALAVCLINGSAVVHIKMNILLLPLCVFQMILLSTGTGIIISSLTTKYRDLAMLVGFGLQLWQYASPVAYGVTLIPEKHMTFYMLNPVSPIITTIRYGLFGVGFFNIGVFLISWLITVIVFLLGLILFNRIEKTFMDTV